MLNVDIDGHHGFLIKTNKSQIFSKNIPAKLIDSGFKKNTILKHFYYRVLYFIFISIQNISKLKIKHQSPANNLTYLHR
jgi:hypothetical protein